MLDVNEDSTKDKSEKYTEDEMYSMFMVFLLFGMDTTGHTLALAIYYVALNPHCLRKLREEN